jgi:23S rRNA (pseudouridine1915-N3)-methyltransferase
MKVRVVSVGKDRSGLFQPAVDEYTKRLKHYTKLDLLELPEGRGKKAEGAAILAKIPSTDWIVALDERGEQRDSIAFSRFVGDALNQSRDLTFVIGGDEGLDEAVLQKAKLTLSLGKMTLPHRLARAVLLEQIYRAFTILRGEPYHRA